jgi:hypothetical protein
MAALGVLTVGMAASMARNGPITRTTVPFGPPAASAPRHPLNATPAARAAVR